MAVNYPMPKNKGFYSQSTVSTQPPTGCGPLPGHENVYLGIVVTVKHYPAMHTRLVAFG